MKCDVCKEGRLVKKTISEKVEIEGAPIFEIGGVQVLECNQCHDILMDTVSAREQSKKILAELINYYGTRLSEVPGRVAYWIRNAVGLSQTDLAKEVGEIDPSAFGHAAARNTKIDRYAALVLLSLAADFVTGNSEGHKLIEKTKHLDQFLDRRTVG